jgi:hypothetical protein
MGPYLSMYRGTPDTEEYPCVQYVEDSIYTQIVASPTRIRSETVRAFPVPSLPATLANTMKWNLLQ